MLKDGDFECYVNNQWEKCSRKKACNEGYEYQIIFSDSHDYSWINDFKLDCHDKYHIYLFKVLFLVGALLSSIFGSSSSDYFGRIRIIKITMFLRSLIILFPLIFPHELLIMISLPLLGFFSGFHTSVSYILISEYVSRFEKDKYQTFMFISGSVLSTITAVYFYIYQNWRIYFLINLLYGIAFCIFSHRLLESPRYLVSKQKFTEAREIFKKIALINIGKEKHLKFEKEVILAQNDQLTSSDDTTPISSLFSSSKNKYYTVAFPFWFLATSLISSTIYFEHINSNWDIYFKETVLNASKIVSQIISLYMMIYLGKKHSMILCFTLSIFSTMTIFFTSKEESIAEVIIIIQQFAYSSLITIIYTYANELYSTDLRGRAMAICIFAEKIGKFAGPVMEDMDRTIFMISSILSLVSCLFLIPIENEYINHSLVDHSEDENED
jgi:putative MFS transporter